MDDEQGNELPQVPIDRDTLVLLDSIAVVRKRTQLEVLTYAVELAQKNLPPMPKPEGARRGRKAAS